MFNHPWNKPLNFLITTLFSLLIFFVPLVFWPTSELFEFNKMMLTYILTGGIFITYLSQAVLNKRLTIRRTPLDIPILLFLIAQILSTVYSIDPHTSIWGYYSRFHGGLASTISYLLLYYIATSHFNKEENRSQLKFVFYSLISSSTLIAFYGILEHFGIDKNLWVQDVQNRVFSTLGQPNWLSAYLVAILPLPLILALSSKESKPASLWATISLTLFICILFTKSRSGIGTTFIVLSLIFLRQIFQNLSTKTTLNFPLTPIISFFILFTFLIGSPWSPNPSQILDRLQTGGPILQEIESHLNNFNLTSQLKPLDPSKLSLEKQGILKSKAAGTYMEGSNSWDIRQVVWEGAIELFRRHPFLGTGLETFGYSYYWTRPQAHNLLSEWDFLYNKAHNEYLNFLATTGFVGTSTYFFLILSTLWLFYSSNKSSNPLFPKDLLFALFIGYLSILITNYFGFSVVPVALLFFLYPAVAVINTPATKYLHLGKGWQVTKKQLKSFKKSGQDPKLNTYQYLLLISLIFILGYWTILISSHWLADLRYSKGKSYNQIGYISEAIPLLESAVSLYPSEPNFRATLAESYANAALATKQQLDTLSASESAGIKDSALSQQEHLTNLALENIEVTREQNPWHLNFLKSEAKIYLTLANIDQKYYQNALTTLLHGNELAPTDAKIIYNIGLLYLGLSDKDHAETAFRQSVELRPNYDQALIELIKLLASNNQKDEAQRYLDQLLHYYPNHEGETELKTLIN